MPELVASCCTLLVLAPLALMPGHGQVPVPADGPGRRLRHDLGLPPVAVVRAGPLCRWLRLMAPREVARTTAPHEHERPPPGLLAAGRSRAGKR